MDETQWQLSSLAVSENVTTMHRWIILNVPILLTIALIKNSIHLIKCWPLSTCLFDILCKEMKNFLVDLNVHYDFGSRKIMCVIIWLVNWTSCFFMEFHFYLKTNYGYSDMSIWQAFALKWTKWDYHFKENNWKYLLPIIKFQLSSENAKLRKLVSTPILKEFMTKPVVILMKVIIWYWNVSTFGSSA
jgi:hypothetical protein